MTLNLFDQFKSPELLFIPITLPAIAITTAIIHNKKHLLNNRTTTLIKWLIKNISKTMFGTLSKKGQKWGRLLTALISMTLLLNLIGLLPYTLTPTTLLSVNMALALPLWLSTVLTGAINKPTATIAHLVPQGGPMLLTPFLILIETASQLMRPLALAVRLTANMTAGHLLIHMISSASISLIGLSISLTTLTTALLMALTFLEMAVACIQAYVFTLLVALYLQENT